MNDYLNKPASSSYQIGKSLEDEVEVLLRGWGIDYIWSMIISSARLTCGIKTKTE